MIETLKQFKKEAGLTQRQLATLINIDCSTLNRWIKGKQQMSRMSEIFVSKKLKLKS